MNWNNKVKSKAEIERDKTESSQDVSCMSSRRSCLRDSKTVVVGLSQFYSWLITYCLSFLPLTGLSLFMFPTNTHTHPHTHLSLNDKSQENNTVAELNPSPRLQFFRLYWCIPIRSITITASSQSLCLTHALTCFWTLTVLSAAAYSVFSKESFRQSIYSFKEGLRSEVQGTNRGRCTNKTQTWAFVDNLALAYSTKHSHPFTKWD